MHGVFVQMVIILLLIPLPDLLIILDYIVHAGPHMFIVPQRKMAVVGVHEDLRLQLGILRPVNVEPDASLLKGLIPPGKIRQSIAH